jgi:hypothetical protein
MSLRPIAAKGVIEARRGVASGEAATRSGDLVVVFGCAGCADAAGAWSSETIRVAGRSSPPRNPRRTSGTAMVAVRTM